MMLVQTCDWPICAMRSAMRPAGWRTRSETTFVSTRKPTSEVDRLGRRVLDRREFLVEAPERREHREQRFRRGRLDDQPIAPLAGDWDRLVIQRTGEKKAGTQLQ